jgi:hypothetical protein
MAKKIAILGKNRICLSDAPWSDYSWELWSLSPGYHECDYIFPRKDIKWFELHSLKNIEIGCNDYGCKTEEYIKFLNTKKAIVAFEEVKDLVKEAEIFPIKELINYFDTNWFKNSIALMIAYAIMTNPDLEELRVYGQTLQQDPKYQDCEDCVQAWLWYAKARGIKVGCSINSTMLTLNNPLNKGLIYGYEKTAEEILNEK